MIQFLNNVWVALTSENETLVNLLMIPATVIEAYIFMSLFLILTNITAAKKQKFIYVLGMSLIGLLTSYIIPSPFNVPMNYICIFI